MDKRTQATDKKSFILYKDSSTLINLLTIPQRGRLLTAIYQWQNGEEVDPIDDVTKMAYEHIISHFKRDNDKYAETCVKRSASGKKGAKQKLANAGKRKHKLAKLADSDSDSDSDSESVNESVSVNDKILSALPSGRRGLLEKWLSYKAEKNQRYKPRGLEALIKSLSSHSDGTIQAAIDASMQNNWAGLFPDRVTTATTLDNEGDW